MAILDFPPLSNGATYTQNEINYLYDGNKWVASLGPTSGTEITTPTITSPVNGAADIDPNVNLTITSSAFNGTGAGTHASTSWQVIRGQTPLRSTNAITAINEQNADWTLTAIGDSITSQMMYTIQDPDNPDRWVGIAANTSNITEIYSSDDNCGSWTLRQTLTGQSNQIPISPWWTLTDKTSQAPSTNNNYQKAVQTWGGDSPGFVAWIRNQSASSIFWATFDRIFAGSGVTIATSGSGTSRFQGFSGIWINETNGNVQIPMRFAGSGNSGNWSNKQLVDARTTTQPTGWTPPNLNGNFVADSPYLFAQRRDNGTTIAFLTESGNQTVARKTGGFDGNYQDGTWAYIDGLSDSVGFQSTFGAGAALMHLIFDERNNLWVAILTTGIFTSADDGNTWVSRVNPMTTGIPWSIVPTATGWAIGNLFQTQLMYTDDWVAYSPLFTADNTTNFRIPVTLEGDGVDGSGETQFSANYPSEDGILAGRFLATIPSDQLELVIEGTQTDGFTVGLGVQQFNVAEEGSGTIIDVNDTSMTLFPVEGTWVVDGQVMTNFENYNLIVDLQENTDNLTTLTIEADDLEPNAEYSARVQYRSNTNVTSLQSDWSTFKTDNG